MNYKVRIVNVKLARRIGAMLTVDVNTAKQLVGRGDGVYAPGQTPPKERVQEQAPEVLSGLELIEPLREEAVDGASADRVSDTGLGVAKPSKISDRHI